MPRVAQSDTLFCLGDSYTTVPSAFAVPEEENLLKESTPQTDDSTLAINEPVLPQEMEIFETTLRVAYGLTVEEANIPIDHWQPLLLKYLEGLYVYAQRVLEGENELGDCTESQRGFANQPSTTHTDGQSDQGTKQARRPGKRRRGSSFNDRDEDLADDSGGGTQARTAKQLKASHMPSPGLSCPYRKKDPLRFGVRQRYSCSMTYFTSFAKLR